MKTIISIDVDSRCQNRPPWRSDNFCFDFSDSIHNFLSHFNKPVTFFVREDHETIAKLGLNFVFDMVDCLPYDIEIGWHPHFYDNGVPIKKNDVLLDQLKDVFYLSERVRKCRLVRMGSCQSNNMIMSFLSQHFEIDSSAMSACFRQDDLRWYDWTNTTNFIYNPSIANYQIGGDPNLAITEFPITTINIQTNYDIDAKKRVLSLAINNDLFEKALDNSYQELLLLDCLVIAIHAEELESNGFKNDLYTYGLENLSKNITSLESRFNCEYTSMQSVNNWWKSRLPQSIK